jgi:hypothetical protein
MEWDYSDSNGYVLYEMAHQRLCFRVVDSKNRVLDGCIPLYAELGKPKASFMLVYFSVELLKQIADPNNSVDKATILKFPF